MVKYTYDAWGNNEVSNANNVIITDENHIGNLNPFRYRGYYYDADTKLYYLKSRYYDPEAGRFISQDGVENLDPNTINGLNLYAYCANNPVMNVDPNGTVAITTILLILGISALVVGAGVAIYAGVTAYNNGVRGWDLVGAIAEGFLTGAVIGAIIGGVIAAFIYGGPAVASFLGKSFSFGGFALAGGGTAVITLTGAQIAALGVAALLGLQIMFAKDPFVKSLERGMSENQKEQFQREIEDYKKSEGRGGADNLDKDLLREIAEFIKQFFK